MYVFENVGRKCSPSAEIDKTNQIFNHAYRIIVNIPEYEETPTEQIYGLVSQRRGATLGKKTTLWFQFMRQMSEIIY